MPPPRWNAAPWPMPPAGEDVALQLEAAAELIERAPGTNVLDALREAHHAVNASELLVSQTYYALLEYLPPHVEYLAPWSDTETAERVATKLRQLARTIRKGGPARIAATPDAGTIVPELDSAARNRVDHPKPGKRKLGGQPGKRTYTPESRLRLEAAQVRSAIVRGGRAAHPNLAKLARNRDRLAVIEAQLDQLQAAAADDAATNGRPLAFAAVGRATPVRRPGTESGL